MAGTQKQRAKGFCSPSGEKRYCSVRKQNFSKSRWREKVPICPAVPHFQSGTVCPAVTAEGERRRYLLDGKFGSKVLGGVCCRIGREVRPMLGPGAPALRAGARGSRFASVGNCAPHFLLSWQKKTCRARYKRKPPFSGLLVRPVKTGLVSSSCAEPLDLSVRSRRSCFIGCKPEGAKRTRGPSCAAAARPGIRSKFLPRRCIYVLLLPTERQRRCCAKQSYLHQRFSISETAAA